MFILFAQSAHGNALEDRLSIAFVFIEFDLESRLEWSETRHENKMYKGNSDPVMILQINQHFHLESSTSTAPTISPYPAPKSTMKAFTATALFALVARLTAAAPAIDTRQSTQWAEIIFEGATPEATFTLWEPIDGSQFAISIPPSKSPQHGPH